MATTVEDAGLTLTAPDPVPVVAPAKAASTAPPPPAATDSWAADCVAYFDAVVIAELGNGFVQFTAQCFLLITQTGDI